MGIIFSQPLYINEAGEYGTDGNLKRIIDLNGNALTFSENGITSSSGLNVIFNRDANGRSTSIIDPVGNVYQYHYDINGDLTTVYIPDTPNPLRYNYFTESGWEHFLKDGFDPLNNRVARMDYDDHGRIIRITDALEQVTPMMGEATAPVLLMPTGIPFYQRGITHVVRQRC